MRMARCVAGVALVVAAGCGAQARGGDATPGAVAEQPAIAALRPLAEPSVVAPPAAEPAAAARTVEEPTVGAEVVDAGPASPRRPATTALATQYDDLAVDWFGDAATCPATGHGAVVDRANQMAWLCGNGSIVREFPITTARSQPDPGTYPVYDKDLHSSSTISGAFSRMTHFVAFTHGKYQGARIAFHSVPTYGDGSFVQPLESVGTSEWWGDSAGCIRVLPDDAVAIWDWLGVGDEVNVIS